MPKTEPLPMAQSAPGPAKCGYCKKLNGAHAPRCPRAASAKKKAGVCACGGVTRHKPTCERYGGRKKLAGRDGPSPRAGRRKRKALSRNDPKAPRGLSQADVGKLNGHRSAEALAIARERIQIDLVDARKRVLDAESEVRVLERLAAGLAGG